MSPPVTDAELRAIIEARLSNPQAVTGDAGSYTEMSADDLLKLAAALPPEGTNANGGSRSGFNLLRPARATFPGAFR